MEKETFLLRDFRRALTEVTVVSKELSKQS
jgi:hypothetical protein